MRERKLKVLVHSKNENSVNNYSHDIPFKPARLFDKIGPSFESYTTTTLTLQKVHKEIIKQIHLT